MIEAGRFLQQRYRIDKQIGQGGMGAVYVATDERFGSTVAIKETLCMDDNFRKAIEREARLLNSLKHASLPRVSDHFEEDNSQFLVMEYVPGDDFCCVMENNPSIFSVEKVVHWADEILDALDYLHNQSMPVIHRDIKPQNLKVTPKGEIVLLDFGLAKGSPSELNHQTAAKSIFGYSRNYASLEQIQGTGTDPRSDLYSLGATLYHVLTNTPPADALTRAMAVLGKRADPLVPANLIDPQIPAGVAGVLQCAMALNAADRPASAAEMRQMFRESEKYASLAAASTTPGPNITAAIPQPTRIMPDNTRRADMLQTDIKTEVLGGNMSEQTSIRPGSTAAAAAATALSSHAPRRKARGLAIGVAAVVLIGAVVAVAGLYFARPTFFGVAPAADEQPEKPVVQSADNTDTPPANSATVSSTAEEATAPELQPETQQSEPSERSRPTGTTRTSKVPTGRSPGGDTDITVTDPDASGETTFRDDEGRTITIRPPTPPRVRGQRPTTGAPEFDLNKFPQLTPAERKRMQQAIRNAQRQQMMQQRNYSEPKN